MGIVVVLDQQQSSRHPDRIGHAIERLGSDLHDGLIRQLVRTAGDEMQAVVGEAYALNKIIEFCLRTEEWWLGVGLGSIDTLGETARESRGASFVAARQAVEEAKRRRRWPIAVVGRPEQCAERLQGMCDVFAFITSRRTHRQWELIDVMRRVGSGSQVAGVENIRPQTANEHLRAAGWREQEALEREVHYLAAPLLANGAGS